MVLNEALAECNTRITCSITISKIADSPCPKISPLS